MANENVDPQSIEALRSKREAITLIQNVVIGLFLVIILAWVIPGLWRKNVTLFASTVVMAGAFSASMMTMRAGLRATLKKREHA